jgi:hypothetical protein
MKNKVKALAPDICWKLSHSNLLVYSESLCMIYFAALRDVSYIECLPIDCSTYLRLKRIVKFEVVKKFK